MGPRAMTRRFARMQSGAPPYRTGFTGVPSDGMCLNVFLVLQKPGDAGRVLLGRVAPDSRWEEAGGLDSSRLERVGTRWMLPSSQLLLLESPDAAAGRLLREQLGINPDTLPAPEVFSETYLRPGSESADPHWDLHFVYLMPGPASPPRSPLWTDLEYTSVPTIPRAEFARGHGDVLELVGLRPIG
jgi:hypothetical protein